jgi:hypothetical protein
MFGTSTHPSNIFAPSISANLMSGQGSGFPGEHLEPHETPHLNTPLEYVDPYPRDPFEEDPGQEDSNHSDPEGPNGPNGPGGDPDPNDPGEPPEGGNPKGNDDRFLNVLFELSASL